ncbi:MAG TPA: hypothetical protein VHW09_28545 [Bryobacteraceae bacterium]|jgi:hypothetical protein|nr:hypothetical protein [Bryobacteraceae bacterium]
MRHSGPYRFALNCAFGALFLCAAGAVRAQSTRLSASCDLGVVGASDTKGFLTFDREFRAALTQQDAGIMALLVEYPLRINDGRGSWHIEDAGSLQRRFQQIFPPALRSAVLATKTDALSCLAAGVMYANGTVWVNRIASGGKSPGPRYLVESINQADGPETPRNVRISCQTARHRIVVDNGADGLVRYRDWDTPLSLLEKPSLEIAGGKETSEGTGACRHWIWTFANGSAAIVLQTIGCYEESSGPPSGAHGQLIVSVKGRPDDLSWCF